MTSSTRRTIIGVIVVAFLILLGLLAWLLWSHVSKPPVTAPAKTAPTTTTAPGTSATPTPSVPVPAPTTAALVAEAKLFIERYASFSSEAGYANLKDVLPLMTDALAAKTQATIAAAKPSSTFYGVTVHAETVTVNSEDDTAGTATITIDAQIQETKGTAAPTIRYQNAVLTFKKIGADWKVDSVTWK